MTRGVRPMGLGLVVPIDEKWWMAEGMVSSKGELGWWPWVFRQFCGVPVV